MKDGCHSNSTQNKLCPLLSTIFFNPFVVKLHFRLPYYCNDEKAHG